MEEKHKKIQKKNTSGPWKRALCIFVSVAAGCLLLAAGSVWIVDPFFHYHAPLEKFPYIVDDQLSQNPGMARQFSYDSVIIGSSMTVNFDTDDFKEMMDLRTLKLSYSGAYPKDDANILEIVYDAVETSENACSAGQPWCGLRAVFLPMDLPTMTADTDTVKYERPEYLYDKNPWNDLPYLLNKDVLLQYILRPVLHPVPTDLSMVYASWWTNEYYDEERVLATHTFSPLAENEMDAEALLPQTKANLEINFIPFIEAHPETEFYFFFPPYSILYWENVCRENHLEATLTQMQYVMDTLLAYDNVHVFFFQDEEDLVCDLNNYADYTHYHPKVNRRMVECFQDGTHEVERGETAIYTESVRKMVVRKILSKPPRDIRD